MNFSRKTIFLTIILLIGAGAIYLGIRLLKPTMVPLVESEMPRTKVEAGSNIKEVAKNAGPAMYGIPLEKPDPTLKPSFSEENFPGWVMDWKYNLTTTTPDYPGLQNVQEIGLRHGSDGTFGTVKEYFIADKNAFQNYLKEHAVPGENVQMPYWYVSIQGKSPQSGVMVVGKNHAALIKQGFPWSLFPEKELDDLISYSDANANGELVIATTSTVPSIEFVSNSLLSKKLLESFHLHLDYASNKNVSDEFEHMHEIQTAGVTTSKGNSFFINELIVNDREALRGAFGSPALYVGERPLYSVQAPGMVPFAGFMLLGEKKALYLSQNGKDWNLNTTDSDIVNFLQNVPLP